LKEWKMTRWISNLALVLGALGFLVLPSLSHAGAMIKEHDCVGNDLVTDLEKHDGGCTPLGSEITPGYVAPGGNGNFYSLMDSDGFPSSPADYEGPLDEYAREGFNKEGCAFPVIGQPGVYETCPTVISPDMKQVGGDSKFHYRIGIKAQNVISPIEVTCSICAARPMNLGPGQTFVDWVKKKNHGGGYGGYGGGYGDYYRPAVYSGKSEFYTNLNMAQHPWKVKVKHIAGPAHLDRYPGMPIMDVTTLSIPGLWMESESYPASTTFIGCKPTTLLLDNTGNYRMGDILDITIKVPGTARVAARMDVTSCEISYIRACQAGEGAIKDICGFE
jgi:hypothetical protein